jgi:hypothetical protein
VLHDIQAYICIAPICDQATEMYTTSKDWLAHMQLHNKRWHCDAPDHAPARFNAERDYKIHMMQAHTKDLAEHKRFYNAALEGKISDGLLEDEELQFLAEINAWADNPMYAECSLCEQDAGNDLGDEHTIDHIRYLALFALSGVRTHLDASTDEGSECSSRSYPARTRTTIKDSLGSADTLDRSPTGPINSRPDDDLLTDSHAYATWGGYDAFIARYPRGKKGMSRATEQIEFAFPFPPEAASTELDDNGYPVVWPADRSVNFTRPATPQSKQLLDYEWQGIIKGLDLKDREHGTNISVYDCPYSDCPKSYSSKKKADINRHVDTFHLKKRPFACSICDKAFSRRDNYKRHLRAHV